MSDAEEVWRRAKTILRGAWDLPADARSAYVTAATGGDEVLRREVLSFLDSMQRAEDWFEVSALGTASAAGAARRALAAPFEGIGSVLGSWRIVRELGHGGMGTVYLAERAGGEFTQSGALKVVRGFADQELLRRFRDERRILAGLEHPYITRLLDGGATPSGAPFVVMEYVDGTPIGTYCREQRLGVSGRLELFRKVCAAVHHAHQRLVIHRDIKENNLLVTADGTPKLLDFGIAKLVEPDGGSAPTLLRAQTPESASPEQVLGRPITIATDIYSLGVLLYRLLTDRSPYGEAVKGESALMRAICEDAPQPPSVAIRSLAGASRLRIRRDLDLIVLKALRKEPERRYSSVEAFAEDVAGYLENRPVQAAPDSWSYRSGKFFRRHRALTVAGGVAFAAIVAGTGLAAYEARVAQQQRLRAERRFADVRRLANSFLFEFHDAIADLPGALKARQLVVKSAADYLDGLAREAQGDVALQRELATAYERLATILGGGGVSNLGDLSGAKDRYLTALSLREKLAARMDASVEDRDALAELRVQLARFLVVTGDLGRAEQEASAAVSLLQSSDSSATRSGRLATALHQLGYVQASRNENAAALASLAGAVDSAKQQMAVQPGNASEATRLARIQIDYVRALATAGRGEDALVTIGEARRSLERLLADEPKNMRYGESLIEAILAEGYVFERLGDPAGKLRMSARAVTLAESLLAKSPDDRVIQIAAMISDESLGVSMLEANGPAAAIAPLRTANVEAEAIIREAPDNGFVLNWLATIRARLGEALLSRNRNDQEGCRVLGDGLALWDRLVARGVPVESSEFRLRFRALSSRCTTPVHD